LQIRVANRGPQNRSCSLLRSNITVTASPYVLTASFKYVSLSKSITLPRKDRLLHQNQNLYDFHFPPRVNVGYPSSGEGVWVFKFSEDLQTWEEEDDRKPYMPRMPDGWDNMIHMALTMDERCELLKEFGATFYTNRDKCEDLSSTLEEGIERGRRYKLLLDNMDDPYYVDKWLSGDGQNTNL
jgi:hypothetical protein